MTQDERPTRKPTYGEQAVIIKSNRGWHLMQKTRYPKWWQRLPKKGARFGARPGWYVVYDNGVYDGYEQRVPRWLWNALDQQKREYLEQLKHLHMLLVEQARKEARSEHDSE